MEVLAIKDLSFTYYGSCSHALKNIDISVQAGELVTICGKSGSGKSTLLRNLKTVLAPKGVRTGELIFFGKSLDSLSQEEQATAIGYVFQNPESQVVTEKVWQELAFGLENLGIDAGTIRLRVAEMANYFGIQNWFHKEVKELSGGQKQLLNLASVMVMQPNVLILDEPTSQLDPISAEEFLKTVKMINRDLGVTVIIAEHRLETVMPMSDRVIVMDDGKIIADGTAKDVGTVLAEIGSSMFMAMPTPIRTYSMLYRLGIGQGLRCPVDIRDGRRWLSKLMGDKSNITVSLPSKTEDVKQKNVIVMRDVWFRYNKNDDDVIRDFSLRAGKGEMLCLLGGNGSGKTTVLNIICGINKPYRGNVNIYGTVGAVPQNPQNIFVGKSVKLDLMEIFEGRKIGLEEIEERIKKIAEAFEIEHLLDMHPYDLSGGEQQRAAIAKVLLTKPDILLLDEPTKGLDPMLKDVLANILKKLCSSGVTVVMVSHDIEFCSRYSDRCAMIFDGGIITSGTPNVFFSGNNFYTTAANKMSRHIFDNAVNAEDIVELVRINYINDKSEVCIKISDRTGLQSVDFAENGLEEDGLAEEDSTENCDMDDTKRDDRRNEKARECISTGRSGLRFMAADVIALGLAAITIFAGIYFFDNRKYIMVSMLLVIYTMIPFFARFEGKLPKAREIVILAVMVTVAVAGRMAFFMLPSFKPMMAIIIITGIAMGRQAGLFTGAMSAFVSNFIFGQGPWTVWQMLAMALIGYLAGAIFHSRRGHIKIIPVTIFGALSVFFIYGAITDLWTIFMMTPEPSFKAAVTVYSAAIPLNAVHAVATVIFLLVLTIPMVKIINRVREKYSNT